MVGRLNVFVFLLFFGVAVSDTEVGQAADCHQRPSRQLPCNPLWHPNSTVHLPVTFFFTIDTFLGAEKVPRKGSERSIKPFLGRRLASSLPAHLVRGPAPFHQRTQSQSCADQPQARQSAPQSVTFASRLWFAEKGSSGQKWSDLL
jgi:hypothetical protein